MKVVSKIMFLGALPIHLFSHFCCKMCRLATIGLHFITDRRSDRQTDRRYYDNNSTLDSQWQTVTGPSVNHPAGYSNCLYYLFTTKENLYSDGHRPVTKPIMTYGNYAHVQCSLLTGVAPVARIQGFRQTDLQTAELTSKEINLLSKSPETSSVEYRLRV